jgi:hypothetical protein
MLLCINGQSRGAGAAPGRAVFFLLFGVEVAILNHDHAVAVFSLKGLLASGIQQEHSCRIFDEDLSARPDGNCAGPLRLEYNVKSSGS